MSTFKEGYRKTRRGQIGKVVEEVYLRRDISCGYKNCSHCKEIGDGTVNDVMILENENEKCIYILDYDILQNQLDVVENCPLFKNIVILQTVIQQLKNKKPNTYNALKNLVEVEIERKMHVFANEFFTETFVEFLNNETQEERNKRAIFNAAKWYTQHLGVIGVQVKFITNNHLQAENAKNLGINAQTIFDFVEECSDKYPNLVDFLGFNEEQDILQGMEIEEENKFEEHYTQEQLVEKIKAGQLFQGKMYLDRNNTQEGKIIARKLDFEIMIINSQNLNRSFHGDIVAVEILPESQWIEHKKDTTIQDDDMAEYEHKDNEKIEKNLGGENNEKLLEQVYRIKSQKLIPTGKVVGILKRIQRNFYGHITPEVILQQQNGIQIREFISTNQLFPNFYIRTKNGKELEDKKITISFNQWPAESPLPLGHFKSVIGKIGETSTEGDLILLEHQVEYKTFSQKVLDCLPTKGEQWQIPQEEIAKRLDLRQENTCSIDPPGCKDIDDALHCKKLPNGNYQVGVHIADVTHFVLPESALDLEAANRCTTVYLVDRRTDMLPKLLTETLCSLVSGVDRLAFSCIWELNPEAEIVNVSFHKSVIHSKASLTYEQAQHIINGKTTLDYRGQKNVDFAFLREAIVSLQKLSQKLNNKRRQNGALSLASTQVKFTFDQETNNPTDVQFYQSFSTNSLVEEFMLLANVSVAEKIVSHFPSVSILRKHNQPKPKQIKELKQIMETLGYKFDHSSNLQLAESLATIKRENDDFFNKTVRILTTRTMNEATYFCTAESDYPEFYHYGLAATLYTHFTSPIRRYADVLVHRLLAASIDIKSLPEKMSNKLKMNKLCDQMNMRNRNARFASRASSDYNTYLFFKDKGDVKSKGIVTGITKFGVSVLIEEFGLEGMIKYDEKDQALNNQYIQKQVNKDVIVEFFLEGKQMKLFDYLDVKVSVTMKNFHKQIHIQPIL